MSNSKKNMFVLGRFLLFTIIFITIFLSLDKHYRNTIYLHPTWEYVSTDNDPIDILYVGNSHTIHTIDAEVLSEATGLNIRCLTCTSINGGIVAAGLEAFLQYNVPKVVVLEMCPFSVDNYEMMRKEKLGIVFQNFDGIPNTLVRAKAISKVADFEDILPGTFQLLRSTEMWNRYIKIPRRETYNAYGNMKSNLTICETINFDAEKIKKEWENFGTEGSMFPANSDAFQSVIEMSEKYGFDIWVLNAPIAGFDGNYANALNEVNRLKEQNPSIKYIDNLMLELQDIDFSIIDFYDNGHLNIHGMSKVTMWMLEKITERMGVSASTNDIMIYKDGSATMLENGKFRYECNAYGNALYSFKYTDKSGNLVETEYSHKNYVVDEVIPDMTNFTVSIKQDKPSANENIYPMMQYNIDKYSYDIQDNTMKIVNHANFSSDLQFAWYIQKCGGNIDKLPYAKERELTYEFTETGEYIITAFTRDAKTDIRRGIEILNINYDADTKEIEIKATKDGVGV